MNETAEKKRERLEKDCQRKKISRMHETAENKQERLEKQCQRQKISRMHETAENKQERLEQDHQRKKISRMHETAENKQERLEQDHQRKKISRMHETAENKQERLEKQCQRQKISTMNETAENKQERLEKQCQRQKISRMHETAENKQERLEKDCQRKKISRMHETAENKQERLEKDRQRQQISTMNEPAENKQERLEKDCQRKKISRMHETAEKKQERLEKDRQRQKISRMNELAKKKRQRLEKLRRNDKSARINESPTKVQQRIQGYKTNRASRKMNESPNDVTYKLLDNQSAKQRKRQNFSPTKLLDTKQQNTDCKRRRLHKSYSSVDLEEKLNRIRLDIEHKTHFAFVCVSDLRYHCRSNVVKLNIFDDDANISQNQNTKLCCSNSQSRGVSSDLSLKTCRQAEKERKNTLLKNMTILKDHTKSFDGLWYICKACKRTIERGGTPSCSENAMHFMVDELPEYLRTDSMSLNKCEAHLLKLIIPFMRVSHIPRSAEFKVTGPMICVESKVKSNLQKIVPVEQDLIPVCLKRRPEYKGNYIEEFVSKSKILQHFEYFKNHNPLFADIEFHHKKLDDFLKAALDDVREQEEWKTSQENCDNKRTERLICSESQHDNDDDVESDNDDQGATEKENVQQIQSQLQHDSSHCDSIDLQHDDERYDQPEYLTEISDDTVIDPLSRSENPENFSELLASVIVEKDKYAAKKAKNGKPAKMSAIILAPGAESSFKHWDTAEFLEEKAFPHLFPSGKGGYLSTYQPKGVGFANYVKQRILGLDRRFREDSTYMFFLYIVKEQIEIKRSYATFFRKSKVDRQKYDVRFFREADKSEIVRSDIGYTVFKNVRGTPPYFQQVKMKVIALIRQLGPPQVFLTMSAAEAHWPELLKMLLQKEKKTAITDEDITSLSRSHVRQILARNVVDVTCHFSNRMKVLYSAFKSTCILSKYKVMDYFFRIEFQQRGAPHVHSLLWLEDEEGRRPPAFDGSEQSRKECAEFIDSIMSGKLPDQPADVNERVKFFQTHSHTFTCRKKSKKIKIKCTEGHGRYDGVVEGPELMVNTCRFHFPKFPIRQTSIISRPTQKEVENDNVQKWKENYEKVRKFIIRQTYTDDQRQPNEQFMKLTFDEFLQAISLTELEYMNALKMCAAASPSGSEIFLRRDCCDVFTNNYNPNILRIHQANMDISFILDEYACVAYILGYLTKNESGLSRLLHQIELESSKYGRTPKEKMKIFSHALDNSREVSRPESVYRMLGLHFCESTRTHVFIQTSHPSMRDGLLRSNLDELADDDNPFYNNIIDYYKMRPDDLERISLAEFARDYHIVYQGKAEKEVDEHLNPHKDDDHSDGEMAPGRIRWLKNKKARFRQNQKHTVVRYHLSKKNDTEIKRNLLILFHPFRDEMRDIHEPPGKTLDELYDLYSKEIETIRKQFEPNRELLLQFEQALNDYAEDENINTDEELLCDDGDDHEHEETTSGKELEHFIRLSSNSTNQSQIDISTRESVCAMIRKLNRDQRQIFDDVLERLLSRCQDDENSGFYLYISGRAGTGKTFLMKTLIEAAKLIFAKSGDDFSKPSVLVLSPTASAARVLEGNTIESAMKLWKAEDSESYEVFSNKATLASEYSQVRAIFIDEISMVGSNKFHQIHLRCEEIFGKKEAPFSGIPVICTGDLLQLPPVQDSWIFGNTRCPNRCNATAPNKWKVHFKMYELTEKMRSLDDHQFAVICDRIGTNSLTDKDIMTLQDRIIECPSQKSNDPFKMGKLAIIVRDNAIRTSINQSKLRDLLGGNPTTFFATDVCRNADRYDKPKVSELPYTRTGSLPYRLEIKVDAPVMLTVNIDKNDRLTNGTRGYVADIDEKLAIIWVKFPEMVGLKSAAIGRHKYKYSGVQGAVPIKTIKASFSLNSNRSSVKIQRTQFPLVLAYAITSHKSQGQTLDEVIVDFSGKCKTAPPGSFYVAATRVRKLSNLYLKSFDKSMITTSTAVLSELTRLKTHGQYTLCKVPLYCNIFQFNKDVMSDEIQVVYININGLLDSQHIQDLDSDANISHADIICISETKLDDTVSNEGLAMSNFSVVSRQNLRNRSMGMIVYKRSDSMVDFQLHSEVNHIQQQMQTIQCNVNSFAICFTYIHPSAVTSGLEKLKEHLRENEFVVGDLNTNYLQNSGRMRIDALCRELRLIASDHGPTRDITQLDHVLIPEQVSQHVKYHVQTFANLYSDHHAIAVRLSEFATGIL